MTEIDSSKSLAELTGVDWGVAPAGVGSLIQERHELRRTPIRDLSDKLIARLLDIGCDHELLVRIALDRLKRDSEAICLLCAVLRVLEFHWRAHPKLLGNVRDAVHVVVNQLGEMNDELEKLRYEVAIWRLYAEFECNLAMS